MLGRDLTPASRARLAVRRPGAIVDVHQARNRKQRLAGNSLCKRPWMAAGVHRRAPSSGVSADVAVESTGRTTIPREVVLRTMHVGPCEQNAVVAKEHSVPIGLVALADEIARLRGTNFHAPTYLGEPCRELGANHVRVARREPNREHVDVRYPDPRLTGDDGSVGVHRRRGCLLLNRRCSSLMNGPERGSHLRDAARQPHTCSRQTTDPTAIVRRESRIESSRLSIETRSGPDCRARHSDLPLWGSMGGRRWT